MDIVMETGNFIQKKTQFILPERDADSTKVFRCLTKIKGLPNNLISDLILEGMIYQDTRRNCVFPCYDKNGIAKGAIVRSTLKVVKSYDRRYRGSDLSYGWLLKPKKHSKLVVVTENPLDTLSIIAQNPDLPLRKKYILCLGNGGDQALIQFLRNFPHVEKILFGLSNKVIMEVVKKLPKYKVAKLPPPDQKDWKANKGTEGCIVSG